MQSTRKLSSLLLLGAAFLLGWQDPEPPPQNSQGPEAKKQSPKVQKGKRGQIIGAPERSPLEGVYRLTSRVVNGLPDKKRSRGYLAITSRHLFINLASPGPKDEHPLVHAGVREWRKVGNDIRTTAKLDYFSDNEGRIAITPEGKQEARHIEIIRGGVRVIQSSRSWLEFERIE